MLSPLSAHGVEKQMRRLAGVLDASVNPTADSATVTYDPARIDPSQIRRAIEDCGFHCSGESLSHHLCEPHAPHAHAAGHHPPALPAGLGAMNGILFKNASASCSSGRG